MASETLAGRLLVATPVLGDPNFRRTVVLIVEHESEQGTLGVVLNRPTKLPVGQVLEPWTELATDPSVVFTGGPVAPNSALALAHVPGTDEPEGWHPLDGAPAMTRLGLVDLDVAARPARRDDRLAAGLRGLRRLECRAAPGGDRGGRLVRGARRAIRRVLRRARAAMAGRAAPPGRRACLRGDVSRRPRPELDSPDVSETEVLPQQDTRVHEDVRPDTSHGDGDHERFAHYVQKDKIVDSSVMGTPLVALCGKVWVPSRDPKRYPVCPTCKEIYEHLPSGDGGDGGDESPACPCQQMPARAGSISAS